MRWIGGVFFLCACNGSIPSLDTSSQTQTAPSSAEAVHVLTPPLLADHAVSTSSPSFLEAIETVESVADTTTETIVAGMSMADENSSILPQDTTTVVENTREIMAPPLLPLVSSVEPITWEELAKAGNTFDAKYAVTYKRKPTGLWISWGAVKLPDTVTTLYYRLSSSLKQGGPTTEIMSWNNQWLNPKLEYDYINQRYGYLVPSDGTKSYIFTVEVKNPITDDILSYPPTSFTFSQKYVYWVQPKLDSNGKASVSMDIQNPTGVDFIDALCKQGGTALNKGKDLPFSVKAFIADGIHRYACSNPACESSKDWVLTPNTAYRDYFSPYGDFLLTNEKSISNGPIVPPAENNIKSFFNEGSWLFFRTVLTGINPDWTTSDNLNSTCIGWTGLSPKTPSTVPIFQSITNFLNPADTKWASVFSSLPDVCFSPIQIDTVNQNTVYSTTWRTPRIGILCVQQ